jgi:endonuclease YncB( thermonuclease family)
MTLENPKNFLRFKAFALLTGLLFTASALRAVEVRSDEGVWSGWVSWVADGDTLLVLPELAHEPVKVRLDGIDAPESCQPGGSASRDAMIGLVQRKTVRVFVRGTDSYGRVLARVEVDGRDVAADMVVQGMAWAYRFRESSGPYAALERQARLQKKGVFADPQAMTPRVFRQFHGSCQHHEPPLKGS